MSTSESLPLQGKSALVTGSSRGIGAAIARRLAADGANVVVNYAKSEGPAQEIVKEINAKREGSAVAIQADVSTVAGSLSLLEKATSYFKKIDIFVFNAAIMEMKPMADIDEQFFDAHFNANVKGPLFLAKAAEPKLEEGSRMIFFSTSLVHFSQVPPSYLVYIATKGAIEQITRVLAKDLGTRGVTVNCIAPGPIDTELFNKGKPEKMIQFFKDMHPQKRIGKPEEVAGIVTFLAGPEASWVNGQTIMVNGGYAV